MFLVSTNYLTCVQKHYQADGAEPIGLYIPICLSVICLLSSVSKTADIVTLGFIQACLPTRKVNCRTQENTQNGPTEQEHWSKQDYISDQNRLKLKTAKNLIITKYYKKNCEKL